MYLLIRMVSVSFSKVIVPAGKGIKQISHSDLFLQEQEYIVYKRQVCINVSSVSDVAGSHEVLGQSQVHFCLDDTTQKNQWHLFRTLVYYDFIALQ